MSQGLHLCICILFAYIECLGEGSTSNIGVYLITERLFFAFANGTMFFLQNYFRI